MAQPRETEESSTAHQTLRSFPGNQHKGHKDKAEGRVFGIEHPGSTGVIYAMDRAAQIGFSYDDPDWANFGQGAPEVGPIEGCMEKPTHFHMPIEAYEYAPTDGTKELRTTVANLYNEIYRQGKKSKYTLDNVCIVPGGRAGLTRLAAAIGECNVGYFLPEYTAYEQMLGVFKRFVPIPATLDEESNYHINLEDVRKEINGRGLGVVLGSNPRNPTGQVLEGEKLKELVETAKERHTTLILDEFYSAYVYTHDREEDGRTVSASEFIDDVNKDPVIIIDGLTKNFRLPGWRVCWIVGPKSVMDSMRNCGSFLEGGANHPLQVAALPLLEPSAFRNEAKYLQRHFRDKRDRVLQRLKAMGFHIKFPPNATFYVWLDLRQLPPPINVDLNFFEECLKEKVIVVPGIFFDINPAHRRELFDSPCAHFVRLSFGPPMDELERGLDKVERVVKKFKRG